MRVLVTGASGFLGRALLPRLPLAGWDVFATGRRPEFPATLPSRTTYLPADLRAPSPWRWLPVRADALVHLAQGEGSPEAVREVAVSATRHLLGWAALAGVRTMILASSGNAAHPTASDAYGLAKQAAEKAVLSAPLPRSVVLRFHTLFGRRQGPARLVPRLAEAVRLGAPIGVAAPDGIRLSLTDVEEAAEAVLRCLAHPSAHGVFDVAGPEVLSVGAIARRFGSLLGRAPVLVPRPAEPGERDRIADPAGLEAALGWRPRKPFSTECCL